MDRLEAELTMGATMGPSDGLWGVRRGIDPHPELPVVRRQPRGTPGTSRVTPRATRRSGDLQASPLSPLEVVYSIYNGLAMVHIAALIENTREYKRILVRQETQALTRVCLRMGGTLALIRS